MSLEIITRGYTVMLLIRALLLTLLLSRCTWAIYKNHLKRSVRIVIVGTAILSATAGLDAWVRAWGRVQQWVCGILPTQSNPGLALFTVALANVGLLVWMVIIEITTRWGIVSDDTPRRRETDPN